MAHDGDLVIAGFTKVEGGSPDSDLALFRIVGDLDAVSIFADDFEGGDASLWSNATP